MGLLLSLFFFVLALAGLLFAINGARIVFADRRLAARVAIAWCAGDPREADRPPRSFPAGRTGTRSHRDRKPAPASRLRGRQGSRPLRGRIRLGATFAAALLLLLFSQLFWGSFLAHPLLILAGAGLTFIAAKLILNFVASERALKITAELPSFST